MMNNHQRLFVLYQKSGPFMYGYVHVVRGSLDNQESSYPFIVSKHIQNREIVFGSVVSLVKKIVRLKFRFDERQRALGEILPEHVKASISTDVEQHRTVVTLPVSSHTDLVLQEQEELLEETIMLTLINLRTLLDILDGKGDRKIDVYDYEEECVGQTSLREIANLIAHNRYFVIKDECLHDLFSGDNQLGSQQKFGTKIKATELFKEIFDCLTGIRVKDFVGVLRSHLARLTKDSEMKDIVFLIQNIHSLSKIMQDRFSDKRFSEVMNLLFRDVHKRHLDRIVESGEAGTFNYSFSFGKPEFKIDDELSERRIAMTIRVDGKSETFKFGYEEFFGVLTKVYGEDPLLSIEQLGEDGEHSLSSYRSV